MFFFVDFLFYFFVHKAQNIVSKSKGNSLPATAAETARASEYFNVVHGFRIAGKREKKMGREFLTLVIYIGCSETGVFHPRSLLIFFSSTSRQRGQRSPQL